MPAKLFIEPGKELGDFLLYNGGGEINIPGGQAGKCFRIAGKQTVQEGRAAP